MQVFHTNHPAFKKLLLCFEKIPKQIPAFSILVCDDKKPIILLCAYHDSGLVFLHGLYPSKYCKVKEVAHALKFAQDYLYKNLSSKFSIVCFTEKNWLKRILKRHSFKEEKTYLYSKEVHA